MNGLPHGKEACFVQELVSISPRSVLCRGRLPAGSPFAPGGRAPAFAALEFAAQAAALLGEGREGYLVRVRELRMRRPSFGADAELTAEVVQEGEAPPLALFRASVRDGEGLILEGAFSVYLEAKKESDT